MGVACKRGAGKMRHPDIGSLWLQQIIAEKRSKMAKIGGKKTPPDILTNFGERPMLDQMFERLVLYIRGVRANRAK